MLVRERHTTDHDDARPDGDGARRLAARRGVVGVLAGALIMLLAASAMAAAGSDLSLFGLSSQEGATGGTASGGGSASADGGEAAPTLTSTAGTCLTWRRDDASDVREVPCAQSHLFESVGPVTAPQAPGTPFPADDAWQQVVTDRCTPLARDYLGGKLDPAGRFRPGALKPTQAAWDAGDRTVRCGLQAPGRSGALFSSTGGVRDADQAVVFDAGTCLGLAGKEVSDPVDCATAHAAEVAGTVDLGKQFTGGLPSVDDQDNYLQPTCAKIAQDHVGGAQKLTDSKLTVYWTNLGQESWDAGTRRVDCNLGALLGDGSGFAPLTGKAAEGVTVGGDAPASTAPLPRPGAPAADVGEAPTAPDADGDAPVAPASPAPAAPSSGAPLLPGLPPVPLPGVN
jgi:hypothetical protein